MSGPISSPSTPAQQLRGLILDGGWRVVDRVIPSSTATGGNFSEGYVVEDGDGRQAFLKALDFSRALRSRDPARALQILTEAFNFERTILKRCRDRRMRRVISAITDGTVRVGVGSDVVQYLIFELADGDVRSHADATHQFDIAFALRTLHQVAIGMFELHGDGIAHQDLKPSNVLVFSRGDTKIADLGRAAFRGATPPHEIFEVAGDPSYAPPELLYHQVDPDWNRRRLGSDAYLFGSMVVFFFTGQGMTRQILLEMDDAFRPGHWGDTYERVLPHLRNAVGEVIEKFKTKVHSEVRDDLVAILRQLCEPDPKLRGHPRDRNNLARQYSLERYVSRLDLLARRAEGGMLKKMVLT